MSSEAYPERILLSNERTISQRFLICEVRSIGTGSGIMDHDSCLAIAASQLAIREDADPWTN